MPVDNSAVARVLGVDIAYKNLLGGRVRYLPQRVVVVGQGADAVIYSTDKLTVTSAVQVGQTFGFGSPLHLAVQQLLPVNGDGVGTIPVTVYPLEADVSGVAAAGNITPSGAATGSASFRVLVNGIASSQFVVADGDTVADITAAITAAVNANLDMPVIAAVNATAVGLTAKWSGASSNDLTVSVVATSEDDSGVTYAITQPVGGLVNPDVQPALDQVGNVWESMVLNCMEIADTTTLDKLATFGEGRWGALVRKPLIIFTGNTATTVAAATTVTDTRKTDRTNSQLVAPGSVNLPFVVAARELARVARVANNNPPRDYGSQAATGLLPGADGDQWDYLQRDQAVKAGSSTTLVRDGVVTLQDIVTMYHPDGDPLPAYRHVVDIVKLQTIIFNTSLRFENEEWDGAPLIPDGQATVNPDAKTPRMAVAEVAELIDGLALEAIISDPEAAKQTIVATINSQNPKRLDVRFTVQLSGNTNIISVDLDFGFYFGSQALVA